MQHDREQFASSCMCVSLLVLVWLVVGVWPDPVYIAVKVSDGKIDGLRAQLKTLQDLLPKFFVKDQWKIKDVCYRLACGIVNCRAKSACRNNNVCTHQRFL